MKSIKIVTWNLEWFGMLLAGRARTMNGKVASTATAKAALKAQRRRIAEELRTIGPDILCLQEGPKDVALLEKFCAQDLLGEWVAIKRPSGDPYEIGGEQYIWFLVRAALAPSLSPQLLPVSRWVEATKSVSIDGEQGEKWPVRHPWLTTQGGKAVTAHGHYRHPQVLTCQIGGRRVDFVGLHLKSKRTEEYDRAAKLRRKPQDERSNTEQEILERVEANAVAARIKLTTEATNVRHYIDARFEDEPNPYIFVLGDLNDGPGKEYFERVHLFHDLVGNLQGDVFFARRFLNHCLFDYMPTGDDSYRWSVRFVDAWEPERDPRILLDHILFTQPLTADESPLRVHANAGRVEHEAHTEANKSFAGGEGTSDHRPVSCLLTVA
ncbi:MAG: endonuclease/exonuclease/phosphatase family protein [Planctomycetes bacterium]|nr:endonuclease/exonuclease/phosphatase family protein [Planctomycetota bacterium]